MSGDDVQRTAAVMAAAAAAVTHLQSMTHSFLLDDDDDDGLGGGGGLDGMGDFWIGEEDAEEDKETRRSYPRPEYMESEWGRWLTALRNLAAAGGIDPDCRDAVRFVEHFRVSYEVFVSLVEVVRPVFTCDTHDVAGRECVPLELKVLSVLKVLGGGNCFKDIHGFTRMSRQTAEASFHHFCEKFSVALWDTWVYLPEGEELKKVEEIYRKCGYPGAIGSVDCTHFKWEATPFSERSIHQGKEGYTTVVVEATCDHSGRIIAATKSYPGAENDKTVIARDESIWRIQDEEPWKSFPYKLRNADGSETDYTGAWLIVDGGYPKIPLLMPPMKTHKTIAEHNWSRRVESVRKDIECCFGRLKGRWRLFKCGILFGSREKIDNAWFTACILHNMLHKHHGLDKMEAVSDWVGSAGALENDPDAGSIIAGNCEPPAHGFEAARARLVAHFKYCDDHKLLLWFKRADHSQDVL